MTRTSFWHMSWTLAVQFTTCSGAEQSRVVSSHWKHWICRASPGAAEERVRAAAPQGAATPSGHAGRRENSNGPPSAASATGGLTAPGGPGGPGGSSRSRRSWRVQQGQEAPGPSRTCWKVQDHKQRAQKQKQPRLLAPTPEEPPQRFRTKLRWSWRSAVKADARDHSGP